MSIAVAKCLAARPALALAWAVSFSDSKTTFRDSSQRAGPWSPGLERRPCGVFRRQPFVTGYTKGCLKTWTMPRAAVRMRMGMQSMQCSAHAGKEQSVPSHRSAAAGVPACPAGAPSLYQRAVPRGPLAGGLLVPLQLFQVKGLRLALLCREVRSGAGAQGRGNSAGCRTVSGRQVGGVEEEVGVYSLARRLVLPPSSPNLTQHKSLGARSLTHPQSRFPPTLLCPLAGRLRRLAAARANLHNRLLCFQHDGGC